MRRRSLVAGIGFWALLTAHCLAVFTVRRPLEETAKAPVLATCVVEGIDPALVTASPRQGWVRVTGRLKVLRSFPQSVLREGEEIRLDYYDFPDAAFVRGSPDLPYLKVGDVVVLPLRQNANPETDSWRLLQDVGEGVVIPAVRRGPPFAGEIKSGMDFVLREVASSLSGGTRAEAFAEAYYLSVQFYPSPQKREEFAPELMRLLESAVGADRDRWSLIAAALASSLPSPRPTIAAYYSGSLPAGMHAYSGPLLTPALQRMGSWDEAKGRLIHQLLEYSDLGIASWGVGITLGEFAQEPGVAR